MQKKKRKKSARKEERAQIISIGLQRVEERERERENCILQWIGERGQ